MNTASNNELETFEKSVAPEKFELSAPSVNVLLPPANASVSRRDRDSVDVDWWSENDLPSSTPEGVLAEMERSVRRRVERFPRSARAHANLGIALLKNDRIDEASEELEAAIQLDPANYIARVTLARLHLQAGRLDEAAACYQAILSHHPTDAAINVALANVLIKLNQTDRAAEHLSRAAELDRHNPYTHFLLGLLCLQKSDLRCALNEFRTASHLDPRNPNVYHAIGVAYAFQNDHQRAEKAFKTALKLAPDSSQIVVSLSRTMLAFRKFEPAIEILEIYLVNNSRDLSAREQLALGMLQAGRYSAARHQLMKVLDEGGEKLPKQDIARHHSNIAVCFMNERLFDKAKSQLKLAIEICPTCSHIQYENLARVYTLTGKVQLGIEVLKRAKELFPSSRETKSLLSLLYADRENYAEAIQELESLQREGALTEDTFAYLASFYAESGYTQKAIDLLMEAYAKFPKSKPIINNLGYCLLMEDQTAQAKEVLKSRPKLPEDHVELVATIGLLHLKEGDYESARRLYKRAESMAAKSSRRDLARRVRQKMHLELARFHARRGEYSQAKREIDAGLKEKKGRMTQVHELEMLGQSIREIDQEASSTNPFRQNTPC